MIRAAEPGDLAYMLAATKALIEHVQKTTRDTYVCNLDQNYRQDIEAGFQNLLKSESARILIAQRDQRPAGFIVGVLGEPFVESSAIKTIGKIEICWVEPEYRQQGIASQLVAELERWFVQAGVEYSDVQYLQGNLEAETSWLRLGVPGVSGHWQKIFALICAP